MWCGVVCCGLIQYIVWCGAVLCRVGQYSAGV